MHAMWQEVSAKAKSHAALRHAHRYIRIWFYQDLIIFFNFQERNLSDASIAERGSYKRDIYYTIFVIIAALWSRSNHLLNNYCNISVLFESNNSHIWNKSPYELFVMHDRYPNKYSDNVALYVKKELPICLAFYLLRDPAVMLAWYLPCTQMKNCDISLKLKQNSIPQNTLN